MASVKKEHSDLAWLVYDLALDKKQNAYRLKRGEIVYTKFHPTLLKITTAEPGPVENFVKELQAKLQEKLKNPPDAPLLSDFIVT
jgi:hypothetical protein